MLSLVIPFKTELGLLEQQLEALAAQHMTEPWEVVIADNGPVPGLAALVARFVDRIPGLRVVDASDRPGAAHARNVGARHAKGPKIAFIDADDVAGDGWVAAISEAIEADRLVASRWDSERLNSAKVRSTRRNGQANGVMAYTYPPFLPHAGGCGLGVTKATHEALGGFDEAMPLLEDTDYCWRAQLAGYPLVFAPDALIHIRFREDARSSFRQAFGFGKYNVLLYVRYLDRGMPKLSPTLGIERLFRHLAHAYVLLLPERRASWLRSLGFRLGRLSGSLAFRVWAP